jgi:hypothetical protein
MWNILFVDAVSLKMKVYTWILYLRGIILFVDAVSLKIKVLLWILYLRGLFYLLMLFL